LRSDRRLLLLAGLPLAFGAACELATIQLPSMPSTVVIHGVLSPSATAQTMLLERTLTGAVGVPLLYPFESDEPVLSDHGIAESYATTQLVLPNGQIISGREVRTFSATGHGGGIYQFDVAGSALVPGGTYRLRVVTQKGETLSGETMVPVATPVSSGPTATFDRSTDTLSMTWPAVPQARGYEVRIDSPYGPWIAFTDSTHVALTGSLRNLAADNLPNLFQPGFRQAVTVSAVDANMYDYYRSTNNAFTGAGIVNHITGGTGVFGSLVIISRRTLDVTAPIERPIEGSFSLVLGNLGYLYGGVGDAVGLTLYVESPSTRSGQPDAITGRYRRSGGTFAAAVGTLSGTHLDLAFLADQVMTDTLDRFSGELRGDSLVGTFSKGAPAAYVRVR
jgi:hypothetical protein